MLKVCQFPPKDLRSSVFGLLLPINAKLKSIDFGIC